MMSASPLFPDAFNSISPFYRAASPNKLARESDPHTSREAFEMHTRRGARGKHAEMVWWGVKEHPGKTYRELAAIVGLDAVEVMRRLDDLRKAGMVESGPERKCTTNGHRMKTWWAK